jgi:hypothetical protein
MTGGEGGGGGGGGAWPPPPGMAWALATVRAMRVKKLVSCILKDFLEIRKLIELVV